MPLKKSRYTLSRDKAQQDLSAAAAAAAVPARIRLAKS